MYKVLKTALILTSISFFACGEKDESKEDSGESDTSGGSVSGGGGGGQQSETTRPGSKDTTIRAIDAYADKQSPNGKKVLMVVAQNGFYFKEYNDPRMEIERAGYAVDVASVTTSWASPHLESGQRENEPGSGGLTPDLSLADADPENYEAVVFAGGWGASMYYFGYEGDIANATWNRNVDAANRVNELIGLFLASNKPVVGVCNGVNILSWARVNDVSPLSGKNATAPDGGAPGQTYLGKQYSDNELIMSKFATDNGAILSAPYSIGDIATASDDVVVDGLLITAQNQFSAQEAGRKLVELLAD